LLYHIDFNNKYPKSWRALTQLENRISTDRMIAMNAAAEMAAQPFPQVAKEFLAGGRIDPALSPRVPRVFLQALFGPDFWPLTLQHLLLVFASLVLGAGVGIPLGVWADRMPQAGFWILGATGMLQTIPSLALLAFLIAALDRIGTAPAIAALFLYSLLPIVRNTEAGLAGVSRSMRQSATALGLTKWPRLRLIELPLAAPTILAGIKTSAVINVGTATIAAFIGAGGYGERIVAGLAVNDHMLLLAGAIPAACMALLIQGAFHILENALVSEGLRAGR
jgi:osmoprotectant transport system permease protein